MIKVYVNGNIDKSALERLKTKTEVVENLNHIEEIDAILVKEMTISREFMEKAKNLKLLSRHGIGCDMIDMEAAKDLGIKVMRVEGGNAESVAELAVSYMMTLSRDVKFFDTGLQKGQFEDGSHRTKIGLEMNRKVLALIGTGSIAQCVSRILQGAFNMKVLAYSPHLTEEKAHKFNWIKCDDLKEMFMQADYINVSIPLTPETEGLIGRDEFSMMKKTAIFINTARVQRCDVK